MGAEQKSPTINDVARLAGVSRTTVSYVFSGRGGGKSRISQPTCDKVLAAAEKLGYVPYQAARSIRLQRTENIGLVLPKLGLPYYDIMASHLQDAAVREGYALLIMAADAPEHVRHILDRLQRRLVDGVVINIAGYFKDGVELKKLAQLGVAVTVLSPKIEPDGFDVVRRDELGAYQQVVEHLVARGHQRVALLGGEDNEIHAQRMQRSEQLLREAGVDVVKHAIMGMGRSRIESYHAAKSLLQLVDRPTAIITGGDINALGAHQAIKDAGLRIPEDIALIGAGNVPEGEILDPPLSTVGPKTLSFYEIADLLFSRIKGEAPAEGRVHYQPWTFIVRGSA